MPVFRIHFADGAKQDVEAATAEAVRRLPAVKAAGPVLKIKRVKEASHGTFNWGWPLTDLERLIPPVPARGAQGFWNWAP